MNVGVPILNPLSGPPDTPWSRTNSPTPSEGDSRGPSRSGSPKPPLFHAPPGRAMVDELTEQSKLAREAAFELLLARSPHQAAQLDQRHEAATTFVAASSARSPGPRSARRSGYPEGFVATREQRNLAAQREQRMLERQQQRARHPSPVKPVAVRPLQKSPGGIWASQNTHIPEHMRPGAFAARMAENALRDAGIADLIPSYDTHQHHGERSDEESPIHSRDASPLSHTKSPMGTRPPPPQKSPSSSRPPPAEAIKQPATPSTDTAAVTAKEPQRKPVHAGASVTPSAKKLPPSQRGAADAKDAKVTPGSKKAGAKSEPAPAADGQEGNAFVDGGDAAGPETPSGVQPATPTPTKAAEKKKGATDKKSDKKPPKSPAAKTPKKGAAEKPADSAMPDAAKLPPPSKSPSAKGKKGGGGDKVVPPTAEELEAQYGTPGKLSAGGGKGGRMQNLVKAASAAEFAYTDGYQALHDSEGRYEDEYGSDDELSRYGGASVVSSSLYWDDDESVSYFDAFAPTIGAMTSQQMLPFTEPKESWPPPSHGYLGEGYRSASPTQPKHVLLEVLTAGRYPIYLRHPGSLPALRSRLAKLLGYVEGSLRVSAEVNANEPKLPPTSERPRLMRVRVSGRPLMTFLDLLFVLFSWLDLTASILFCLFALYLPPAPAPWAYAAPLPLITLYLHGRAAYSALRAEYKVNSDLQDVMSRKAGEAFLIVLLSILGPETILLLGAISLLPRGVRLSDECQNVLFARAAIISPLTLDLPLLIVNAMLHISQPYDVLSKLCLYANGATILLHTPFRIQRMLAAQKRQAEKRELDGQSELSVGDGVGFDWQAQSNEEMQRLAKERYADDGDDFERGPRQISPMRSSMRKESQESKEAMERKLADKEARLDSARKKRGSLTGLQNQRYDA